MNCSETLRYIHELFNESDREEPSDGFVSIREAELDNHVLNVDADHFELIGMRSGFNAAPLFEFYSNVLKNSNDAIINSMIKI